MTTGRTPSGRPKIKGCPRWPKTLRPHIRDAKKAGKYKGRKAGKTNVCRILADAKEEANA